MLHQALELDHEFPHLLLQQDIALVFLIAANRKGYQDIRGRNLHRLSPPEGKEELSKLILFLLDELEVDEVVSVGKWFRRDGKDEGVLGGADEGDVRVESTWGYFANGIEVEVCVLLAHEW